MCVCVYVCMRVCVCVCMYVCMYVCVYVCMAGASMHPIWKLHRGDKLLGCVYACVCMYVCVCVCVCMYVCVRMCVVWLGWGLHAPNLEVTQGRQTTRVCMRVLCVCATGVWGMCGVVDVCAYVCVCGMCVCMHMYVWCEVRYARVW